jgi:integrase
VRKQVNPFAVRHTLLPSGERLPMLLSRTTGIPLFEPTVWSISELRARNLSSSTLQQALRAVMVLHLALEHIGVDLGARLDAGRLIDLGEIEELTRQCRLPLEDQTGYEEPHPVSARPKVVLIERARMSADPPVQLNSVDPNTVAIRIRYIRDYLAWLTKVRQLKLGPKHELYHGIKTVADMVTSSLTARIPSSSGRNSLENREGLSAQELAALRRIIALDSPDNPWNSDHLRERNALIVNWLLSLGVRRGELLGVRISDINFQTNEVLIARRADSPDDPRKDQPNTKTLARLLSLEEDLAAMTRQYVMGARRRIPGAKKHEFLIVAEGTGAPMTLSALNKLFEALRSRCPELPRDFNAHVLRHTWNDLFSALMTERKVSAEDEKRMRAHVMGWSPTSDTAATYTRRYVREQARLASIALQKGLNMERSDEK